jgi:hypothetical protein
MKLSEFKNYLSDASNVAFVLPDGKNVPTHFHITEAGLTTKSFIDCGGTIREEKVINFQLWEAGDLEHRLSPEKLLKIISISEKALGIGDHEIEVEYDTGTIGRYGVETKGKEFLLTSKHTACLASDACGTKNEKKKLNLSELAPAQSCCTPGTCC